MKIKTEFPKFWPILWLCTIALVVMGAALSPSNLDPTQFINNGPVNGQPLMSIRDGAVGTNLTINNITNVNIYSSNGFFTNITVNEFRGRTTITTNLFSTNAFITYLTNITAYVTNLFAVTEYVTNLNVTYLTNQTFYTTNLFATTINATTNINDFNITTNLYVSNVFATNITVDLITNNTFFTTNIFATTVNATTNFNTFNFSTNLFSTNVITTNLFATFITNDTIFTTNIFATTINTTTNISNFNFSTNLISSNIYTTNIFVMEASWFTNRWVGPTNDVNFDATYQNFVASTDMEITGFQNSIATNANTSVLLLDPGGATRTLYFPAPWTNFTSDGNNAYVIPKTNTAIVTLFQYGNLYTNVVVRLFGPGTGTPAPVAQVWTNSNGTNFWINAFGPKTHFESNNGQLRMGGGGTNTDFALDEGQILIAFDQSTGDPNIIQVHFEALDSPSFTDEAFFDLLLQQTSTNSQAMLQLQTFAPGGANVTIQAQDGSATADPFFMISTSSGFNVDNHGKAAAANFVDTAFAANGVVTNDSTGLLHTTPTLPSTLLPTDIAYTDKNNAFTTASSNYVAMTVTTSTNQNQVTPDFSIPEQLMSTNAAFKFLAPVGVDATKTTVQWTLVNVTNTTAAAVLITSPDNCHTVGTAYVTNLTAVWFQCYAQKFTNAFYIPVF